TSDDDEIHPVRNQARRRAEALATEALHAVPLHRAPDLAAHHEAQARGPWPRLRSEEEREVAGADSLGRSIALGANELRVPAEAPVGAHPRADGARADGHYFL